MVRTFHLSLTCDVGVCTFTNSASSQLIPPLQDSAIPATSPYITLNAGVRHPNHDVLVPDWDFILAPCVEVKLRSLNKSYKSTSVAMFVILDGDV